MTEEKIDDAVCDIMQKHGPDGHIDGHEMLTAFVMERIAAERERCAKLCDQMEGATNGVFARRIREKTPNV